MKVTKTIIAAACAIAVVVGALSFTSRSVTPKEATWADVLAEAKKGEYQILTTDEAWARYTSGVDDLIFVDTRQEWEYRTGHIKGSVNFPMEPTWLSRWQKKGALEAFLGPDKNRFIVFY
jgi:3-mercaptopyruvate sulfurtransferase SseA